LIKNALYENVSEKKLISADEGATKRALRNQYAIAITKNNDNTKTTNNKGKIHGVFFTSSSKCHLNKKNFPDKNLK
jgi:hypothetical protein